MITSSNHIADDCQGLCLESCFINDRVAKEFFWILVIILFVSNGKALSQDGEKIPLKFVLEPALPRAIVFNVDELLWPYKVDRVMTPPLRPGRNKNEIRDRMGKIYRLFNDTRTILDDLFAKWYLLGGFVISTDPEKIENIMSLYDIERYFRFYEVFPRTPGCKVKHMKRMSERLDVKMEEILYFDADEDQLDEVEDLEVTTYKVTPRLGLTHYDLRKGLCLYQAARNVSQLSADPVTTPDS